MCSHWGLAREAPTKLAPWMVSFYQAGVRQLVVRHSLLQHPEGALDSALQYERKLVVGCRLRQDLVKFQELGVEQAAVAIYKNDIPLAGYRKLRKDYVHETVINLIR